MPDPQKPAFWFPAKRNGFGWNLPCRWQGWLFLFLWLSFGLSALLVLAAVHSIAWAGLLIPLMLLTLLIVVTLKGEPLR